MSPDTTGLAADSDCSAAAVQRRNRKGNGVVLLHGIWLTARSMRPLERALQAQEYRVANLAYPSRHGSLEVLADGLRPRIAAFAKALDGEVHIVTHSMGGLVARCLVARWRPTGLGRVVMLGPPNRGSEVADRLAALMLYRLGLGPAGAELTTAAAEVLAERLGPIDTPLGIVAGNRSLDPVTWAWLPPPHDGRVTVAATRLAGMTDHAIVPVAHPFLPRDPRVIRLVLAFLSDGRFPADTAPLPRPPEPLISRPS